MTVRKLPSGDLLAPESRQEEDGVLVYGRRIVERGTPLYNEWIEWLGRSGTQPHPMSEEELELARQYGEIEESPEPAKGATEEGS